MNTTNDIEKAFSQYLINKEAIEGFPSVFEYKAGSTTVKPEVQYLLLKIDDHAKAQLENNNKNWGIVRAILADSRIYGICIMIENSTEPKENSRGSVTMESKLEPKESL